MKEKNNRLTDRDKGRPRFRLFFRQPTPTPTTVFLLIPSVWSHVYISTQLTSIQNIRSKRFSCAIWSTSHYGPQFCKICQNLFFIFIVADRMMFENDSIDVHLYKNFYHLSFDELDFIQILYLEHQRCLWHIFEKP